MKTAIYIEAGVTQVVLTGEDEFERDVLTKLSKAEAVSIKDGGFYACNGGWTRQSEAYEELHGVPRAVPSLMLIINKPNK